MNIAEDLIRDKNRELFSMPVGTRIAEAVTAMVDQNVGCLLITEKDEYVGIWTERDLLQDFAKHGSGIENEPVDAYMSQPLQHCEWNDSVYKLMDKFLGLRVRHLLVKKDGRFIGLLSTGDVMKASIREKNQELAHLNATLSWDYYEEWRHR